MEASTRVSYVKNKDVDLLILYIRPNNKGNCK